MVRMDEWSVLTKIFVPKREVIREGLRKLKKYSAHNLYFSTNIINSVELVGRNMRHSLYKQEKVHYFSRKT
jgi:hypothetical protein